jgi:PAS domain S-box-containing protein
MQALGSVTLRSFQTAERIVGTSASLDTQLVSLLRIVKDTLGGKCVLLLVASAYLQEDSPSLVEDPSCEGYQKKGIILISIASETIDALSSQGTQTFSAHDSLPPTIRDMPLCTEHSSNTLLLPLTRDEVTYGILVVQREQRLSKNEMTIISVFSDQLMNAILFNVLKQKEEDCIFNSEENGLFLLTGEGTILRINEQISSILGYASQEMVGFSVEKYVSKKEYHRFMDLLRSPINAGSEDNSGQYTFTHKDGSTVPLEIILHNHSSRPQIYCTLIPHVNHRQFLKRYYETIIQTIEDIIFILDLKGKILFFNKKAREIMGNNNLSKSFYDLIIPENRELVKKMVTNQIQGITSTPLKIQIVGKQNKKIWFEISSTPLYYRKKMVGICSSARDISEKMQLEDQRHHLTVIANDILQRKDLDEILNAVAQAIRNYCGFGRVIISLLDEQFHTSNVAFAGLSEEEKALALERHLSPQQRRSILSDAFRISQSYYIRHDQVPWNQVGVQSRLDPEIMEDWHPDDFLFIPLFGAQKRVIGLISVDDPSDGKAPTEDSLAPVELFATQAAIAIENARLYAQISQYAELLESKVVERTYKREALLETNYRLRETISWEKGMKIIIEGISKGFGFENAEIFLVNEPRNVLENIAVLGSEKKPDISLDNLDYVAAQCVAEKIPINIIHASQNPRVKQQIDPILESFAWVPILTQDEVLGAISVFNKTSGIPISHEELDDLLLFANQAAHFVESTRFEITPAVENTLKSEMKYSLEGGERFLIENPQPDKGFDIFLDCVTHGIQGFSICRTHPKKIKRKYGLKKTPVLWLSTSGAENSIDPKDLAKINHIINEFLQKASNSVVLLEGIEYLIIQNDFDPVIKTIHSLNDYITISDSRLLIPVNPKTLSEKELSILEKEFSILT